MLAYYFLKKILILRFRHPSSMLSLHCVYILLHSHFNILPTLHPYYSKSGFSKGFVPMWCTLAHR